MPVLEQAKIMYDLSPLRLHYLVVVYVCTLLRAYVCMWLADVAARSRRQLQGDRERRKSSWHSRPLDSVVWLANVAARSDIQPQRVHERKKSSRNFSPLDSVLWLADVPARSDIQLQGDREKRKSSRNFSPLDSVLWIPPTVSSVLLFNGVFFATRENSSCVDGAN